MVGVLAAAAPSRVARANAPRTLLAVLFLRACVNPVRGAESDPPKMEVRAESDPPKFEECKFEFEKTVQKNHLETLINLTLTMLKTIYLANR